MSGRNLPEIRTMPEIRNYTLNFGPQHPAAQLRQDAHGPVALAIEHEVTRALGDEEQRHQEHCRGQNLDPEHPAPGLEAQPERRRR